MIFFSKFFEKNKKKDVLISAVNIDKTSDILLDDFSKISIPLSAGDFTSSLKSDFYVYEWFIKDTKEIFYVGTGRKDHYKTLNRRGFEFQKIREIYDTDVSFVENNLTEEQSLELKSVEIERILNSTNHRLINRIIPFMTTRGNGYNSSFKTPKIEFEKSPFLYASEIEEHYFGTEARAFDEVKLDFLKSVVFIIRNMSNEVDIIYNSKVDEYQEEVRNLLALNGSKILKSKYAKSATCWIYIGDDYVTNYESDQEQAIEKIGRRMPTYHLIDVWKFLKDIFGEVPNNLKKDEIITTAHKRISLKDIKNKENSSEGFNEGAPLWEKGEKERKEGNLNNAIKFFDEARYNGYDAPALYNSYAMVYRKLKDYDNEIVIIEEAIERATYQQNTTIIKLKERRVRALELRKHNRI